MTEILARIRVEETHGIRRFLYPLSAEMTLPYRTNIDVVGLSDSSSEAVPMQLQLVRNGGPMRCRLDFPVSLTPFTQSELLLTIGGPRQVTDDPLNLVRGDTTKFTQKRFAIEVLDSIRGVVYDGIPHLRTNTAILRNDELMAGSYGYGACGRLTAHKDQLGQYNDACAANTHLEITACKSWATMTHTLDAPKPGDEIVFTLPLAVTSQTLTCDFGAGGGIYGKLDAANAEIIWRTEFDAENGAAKWTVENSGRVDYVGEAASRNEYLPQRWFHVVDSDKALAAAVTHVPDACETLTVTLNANGDVRVAFTMGEQTNSAATFGVCWHFLNDVPAIAAATNPQSILLPPTVEVL